jgi:hypothetical protein
MEDRRSPLSAVEDERQLIIECVGALEATEVVVERADLALAMAVLAARYENVLADAFYPQIVDSLGMQGPVEHAEGLLARVRRAITDVRADLRGVVPINAHLSDPDGLEEKIDSMTESLRALLDFEDDELFKLVDLLDPVDSAKLRDRLDEVSAHETSLPDPPDHPVMRKMAEIGENVSLSWNDRSTAWHPGIGGVLKEAE